MKKLGNILAGVVSVIYFFVLFAMTILVFISNIFSANYYTDVLKNIDLAEIKLTDFGLTSFSEEFGEDASVEDVLVQSLEEAGISNDDAIKIVNNEKIKEVIGKFFSDTMNYLTNKEEVPQLDYQDVVEIVKSNEISSVLEEIPSDAELRQFVDKLNKFLAESLEGGLNNDNE